MGTSQRLTPGTLYVVATPIGNLEDITLRALRVLRDADLIAAEDTRHTAKLLTHYSIATPTISFHAHNTRGRVPQLIGRLRAGATVALVSDAGTPGISDPGLELIQACVEAGLQVDPIPGASAHLAALVGSGFPLLPVTFHGFPPTRSKDRMYFFASLKAIHHTQVFLESPHRLDKTLRELLELVGERPISVGRELTKAHQQFLRGTPADIIGLMPEARGEFAIVLGPARPQETQVPPPSDADLAAAFGDMAKQKGVNRRDAIQAVAARFGVPAKDVYKAVEAAKFMRNGTG